MKKTIAAVVAGVALAALAGAANAKEWKQVRIATEGAYPPWNATNAAGQLEGFEVELAQDLCKRMNVECEIVAQDWDGIIPGLQSGKYDVIMAGMSVTDERKKVIDFAGPYATEPTRFATMQGSKLLDAKVPDQRVTLDEVSAEEQKAIEQVAAALKGKTVGVQVSTIQANMLEEHFPDVEMRTYDKLDSAGLDLAAGRIDALLADQSAASALSKDAGNIVLFGPGFSGGVLGKGVGAGVRQADQDLKQMFDKAIAEATKDGTIGKLSTKWFGFDIAMPQ